MIFVTHNLGIVARMCDRVAVMYAGRIVEIGPVRQIFTVAGASLHAGAARVDPAPRRAARRASPRSRASRPTSRTLPAGCAFAPRCPHVMDRCRAEAPPELAGRRPAGHARCWLALRGLSDGAAAPPLLEVTGLTKHFPVRRGHARLVHRARARGGFDLVPHRRAAPRSGSSASRAAARRRRRSSSSGSSGRPPARSASRAQTSRASTARRGATTGARSRPCSRTRTPRSIRACAWAPSSPSRS